MSSLGVINEPPAAALASRMVRSLSLTCSTTSRQPMSRATTARCISEKPVVRNSDHFLTRPALKGLRPIEYCGCGQFREYRCDHPRVPGFHIAANGADRRLDIEFLRRRPARHAWRSNRISLRRRSSPTPRQTNVRSECSLGLHYRQRQSDGQRRSPRQSRAAANHFQRLASACPAQAGLVIGLVDAPSAVAVLARIGWVTCSILFQACRSGVTTSVRRFLSL